MNRDRLFAAAVQRVETEYPGSTRGVRFAEAWAELDRPGQPGLVRLMGKAAWLCQMGFTPAAGVHELRKVLRWSRPLSETELARGRARAARQLYAMTRALRIAA